MYIYTSVFPDIYNMLSSRAFFHRLCVFFNAFFYTADKLNVSFGNILRGLYFKLNLCLLVVDLSCSSDKL